jgi:hypothetical protein
VTGYQLQRQAPAGTWQAGHEVQARQRRRIKRLRAELKRANSELKRVQEKLNSAETRQSRADRREALVHRYDAATAEIFDRVKPRTMTSVPKLFGLVEATRYVVQHDVPGDIVECGVWRGGSMQAVALTLNEQAATDRDLHLFDTFEGMPPPTELDRRPGGPSAEELLAAHDRGHRLWAVAGLGDVQQAMRDVEYPWDRIHFHVGMVEETIPDRAPDQIAILRLDTDWYESTRHELEHLYERISPGGVLIIDDYRDWEGARLATDEFLQQVKEPLLMLPIGTGRIAVKPLA